jgi:hypothetical protein
MFGRSVVTERGRIGHPGAIDRKLVRCIGVTFEDRRLRCSWTFRMYEAYGPNWPAMDVWTVREETQKKHKGVYHPILGNQRVVEADDVPEVVKAHAMSELVRLRLRGKLSA